jgi:adenylate cyclase
MAEFLQFLYFDYMARIYEIRVYESQELLHLAALTTPVELGRQSDEKEQLFGQTTVANHDRFVIAPLNELNISRQHVLLEDAENGRIRVTNISKNRPVYVTGAPVLRPGSAPADFTIPLLLTLGERTVRVAEPEPHQASTLTSLPDATRPPGQLEKDSACFATLHVAPGGVVSMEDMIGWLEAAMEVLQSAANSSDFFAKAAKAAVELVGLDSGMVLLLDGGIWKAAASHHGPRLTATASRFPSQRILGRVQSEKRTFWQLHNISDGSLTGVQAVVAAPILGRDGEVIGALYGDRRANLASMSSAITKLDAMLVELLARGVATGLARLEQEKALVRLEQFFTPDLARQLATRPELLRGRDAHVSFLFCDIRGFSRITEKLGPAKTVEWIGSVMEALSDCVLEHRGVVVDYVGDEIMAMWGMPEESPNHAELACRAAFDMLGQIKELNEQWHDVLGGPIDLGIGINSGQAYVGNIGSPRKLKYGAIGKSVNLASRVQGATKYLHLKILITGETCARLGSQYESRRLCKVRVVNMVEPVELFEMRPPDAADWSNLKRDYEQALDAFERKCLGDAVQILGSTIRSFPDDGPSLVLLSRAVNAMVQAGHEFDPVWELPGK